ncbi:MAG: MazG family protein [Chloroflexia bacterium]|nr:MazG family protein [Chloroflexia bacterium]
MTSRITVVGLGPGDPSLRTLGTQAALVRAARIVLRTRVHPGLADLQTDSRVSTCDDLYESQGTFAEVYRQVVNRVFEVAAATAGETVFAVPGHPRFGEQTVSLLIEEASKRGVTVDVLAAVSFLDVLAASVVPDPLRSRLQLVDALDLQDVAAAEPFAGGADAIDPARGCLVAQVYSRSVASAVKLQLGRFYPDDHVVWVVTAAGVPGGERIAACALWELDRQPVDHLTSVWVPPLAALDAARSPHTLQRIAARLRAPDGCPWDRKQTHASIRQAVIEEAYETVDAIDADDPEELADELGDLLLQVALHSQIAEEAGAFTLEDVYEQVNRKLIRRHPHVFGEATALTAGEVVKTWDAVKAAERVAAGKPLKGATHPLADLPRSMPAIEKARVLLGPRKGEREVTADADADAIAASGATILAAVEAAIAAGVDPEQALDRALWTRFAATPQAMETTRP